MQTLTAAGISASIEQSLPTTITRIPIANLKCDPRNPRLHSDRQISQLAKSIKSFGFLWPVMIDGMQRVLAGHGRIEAAKRLGLQEVPTISVHHLSESQRRAFMIADNRLAEQASWDKKLLAEQLKELCEVDLDFDLEAVGFEVGEIDVLIEGASPESKGESDPADELPENKGIEVSRKGDLWLAGPHRIYCGNCLDPESYLALMDSRRASMVFTDPPFNVKIDGHATGLGAIRHREFPMGSGEMTASEFTDFLARGLQRCACHSLDGSLHYVFMDWRHLGELLAAGKHVYSELKGLCVWVKDNGGMGSLYRSQHELVLIFKSGKEKHRNNVQLGQYGRYRTNVWHYPGANSFSRSTDEGNLLKLHPTVKPVALVADAIMDCTSRQDIVLDPFLGSGTTVIAAERTGRVCFGIELDPIYVDTIVSRWQAFTGQSARQESSGLTFAELEKEASSESRG
ncbi:MAG TPA: DNA methyltransferase [Terriglobia bacterium]|nr:DNA methyltransferase [Terriglobia bacterium]